MYKDYDLGIVIPVRLGSSRVKQKALLTVGGQKLTLLAWKIRQLKKIISSDCIYVSTEAQELKDIASDEGVKVHHRDEFLADGHKASFSEVIVGVVKDIPHEHIAWVTCVVPLMSPQEYLQGFREYKEHVIPNQSDFDSLVSVNLLREYFWNDEGPINYQATKKHTVSQELPNMYRVTNGLYMAAKEKILEFEYLLGKNPFKSCVSKIAGIDIDEYEDYEIARNLTGMYSESEENSLKSKMVFLDFDGVIFSTAEEAYAVAVLAVEKFSSLDEVDFDSDHAKKFLKNRYLIGPAWNYYYLLEAIEAGVDDCFDDFLPEQPGQSAREFMTIFFAKRNTLRTNNFDQWLELNKLYPGSQGFLDLIDQYQNISVVTTKDAGTVRKLLEVHGVVRNVNIYDNTWYEKYGCKSQVINELIEQNNVQKAIFVDDSEKHLKKCGWVKNLTMIQALWGYVAPEKYHDNKNHILNEITKMLAD